MSSLQEIVQQVAKIRRDLDQQTRIINEFQRANRQNIELVMSEFQGSQQAYDQLMSDRLRQVEESLMKSSVALGEASSALLRVQLI